MDYRIYIPRNNISAYKAKSRSATAAYELNYHFVFRTKWSHRAFQEESRASETVNILKSICHEKGYMVLGMAVMPEHVHIVLSLLPDIAPSTATRYLKGISARNFHKMFEGSGSLWSNGYSVEAVGKKNVYQVLAYLARQDEHHKIIHKTIPG
jgi:putative transposase